MKYILYNEVTKEVDCEIIGTAEYAQLQADSKGLLIKQVDKDVTLPRNALLINNKFESKEVIKLSDGKSHAKFEFANTSLIDSIDNIKNINDVKAYLVELTKLVLTKR